MRRHEVPRFPRFPRLIILTLALPLVASAQTPKSASIDSIFARFDQANTPGCAVGVVQDGKLAYQRGYGMANLDYDIPNAPHMIYYVGSVSKQFTAATILLMAQRGLVSLDDPVRKYFPELPDYGKPLTIRHLVHHTGGVRDIYGLMSLAGISMDDVLSERRALGLITSQRQLNFEPGAEYLYSNSGYYLLALLVQRVTGKSLREYADEVLFKPLGMTNTHFHDEPQHIFKNRAFAYAPDGRGGYRIDYILHFDKIGAGGLYSTIGDLAKWDQNFYDGRVGGKAFIEGMHQQGVLNNGGTLGYAFGLDIGELRGLKTVRHGGALMGFRADYVRFPQQRLSVITLCNVSNAAPATLNNRVAELYLASQMKVPVAATSTPPQQRPNVAPVALNFSEYAGSYRSDELGVEYRVTATPEGLRIEFGDRVQNAVAIAQDTFRVGGLEYHFTRTASKVDGFLVNAGRVTGIRFTRR
jgi:CubicO group peptidase (beta-lactamase class C family)